MEPPPATAAVPQARNTTADPSTETRIVIVITPSGPYSMQRRLLPSTFRPFSLTLAANRAFVVRLPRSITIPPRRTLVVALPFNWLAVHTVINNETDNATNIGDIAKIGLNPRVRGVAVELNHRYLTWSIDRPPPYTVSLRNPRARPIRVPQFSVIGELFLEVDGAAVEYVAVRP